MPAHDRRMSDWRPDVCPSDLQVQEHATLALLGQMPRNMTGKRGLADAAALIGHYDCPHRESLQWLRHGLLVPAVMSGAVSRSEAILRLHIPWVRIVVQVEALALAARAGLFGWWVFAEENDQHEDGDGSHS